MSNNQRIPYLIGVNIKSPYIKLILTDKNNTNNDNLKNIKQACHSVMKGYKNNIHDGDHDQGELPSVLPPWPPGPYICSFCKKEFRSAQALGGHMNIHRRDRAKLMRYSPIREAMSLPYCSTMRWHKSVEMTKKKTTIHQDYLARLKPKNLSSPAATTTKNVEIDAPDLQIGMQKPLDLELRLGYK